jgi:hypothetical protein
MRRIRIAAATVMVAAGLIGAVAVPASAAPPTPLAEFYDANLNGTGTCGAAAGTIGGSFGTVTRAGPTDKLKLSVSGLTPRTDYQIQVVSGGSPGTECLSLSFQSFATNNKGAASVSVSIPVGFTGSLGIASAGERYVTPFTVF